MQIKNLIFAEISRSSSGNDLWMICPTCGLFLLQCKIGVTAVIDGFKGDLDYDTSGLDPFSIAAPFFGDELLRMCVVCPRNGTAVVIKR